MKRKIIITAAGLSMGIVLANSVTYLPVLPSLVKTNKLHAASIEDVKQDFSIFTRANNEDVKDGLTAAVDFPTAANNLLGYAAYFHIFANSAHLTAHVHGNVAVANFSGTSNFGTGIHKKSLEKDIHYIQDLESIPNSSFVDKNDTRDNKVVFGNALNLDVSGHKMTVNGIDLDHLTKEEIYQDKDDNKYIDFDNVFQLLNAQSMNLVKRESDAKQLNRNDFPDENNRVINLKDYTPNADNEIIVNLSADVLTLDRRIIINGIDTEKSGTTVIINVDTEGVDTYDMKSPIWIRYNNGEYRYNKETDVFDDNHLLWNFYDSKSSDTLYRGTIKMNATFQGSVLAPAADITLKHNFDGNIVANNVHVKGGETHRWDLQDSSEEITEFPDVDPPGPTYPETPDPGNPETPGPTDPDNPDVTDPSDPDPDDIDIDEDLKPETNGGSENPVPDLIPDPDLTTDGDKVDESSVITQGTSEAENPLTNTMVETLAKEVSARNIDTGVSNVTNSDNETSEGFLPKMGISKSGVLGFLGASLMTIIGTFGYKRR